MNFGDIFAELGQNVLSNVTLQAVFLVSILDFGLGTLKALQNGTFELKWIDAWVGDHLLKAVSIAFGIVFGIIAPDITVGDFSFSIIALAAEAAGIAYVAKTAASALGNLNFGGADAPPASVDTPSGETTLAPGTIVKIAGTDRSIVVGP